MKVMSKAIKLRKAVADLLNSLEKTHKRYDVYFKLPGLRLKEIFFSEIHMSSQSPLHPTSAPCELLPPSFDWTFKQIFSDPELLKNFLMSVLQWDYAPIESIEFLDKDVLKNALTDKDSRLDLKVIMQD